jgi:hypothetical protein
LIPCPSILKKRPHAPSNCSSSSATTAATLSSNNYSYNNSSNALATQKKNKAKRGKNEPLSIQIQDDDEAMCSSSIPIPIPSAVNNLLIPVHAFTQIGSCPSCHHPLTICILGANPVQDVGVPLAHSTPNEKAKDIRDPNLSPTTSLPSTLSPPV